jgi:hypothetical protein
MYFIVHTCIRVQPAISTWADQSKFRPAHGPIHQRATPACYSRGHFSLISIPARFIIYNNIYSCIVLFEMKHASCTKKTKHCIIITVNFIG